MLILAGVAAAQVPTLSLDAELLRASVDSPVTVWTDAPTGPEAPTAFARATTGYAHRPVVYTFPDGEQVAIVSSALRTDLAGGFSSGRLRGALILPVSWSAGSDVDDGGGSGIGDLGLDGRVTVFHGAVDVAIAGRLQVPTSDYALPLGSPGLVAELTAVVGADVGPVTLLANVGPRIAPRSSVDGGYVDDALSVRLAAVVPAGPLSLGLEGVGRLGFGSFAASSPAELSAVAGAPLGGRFSLRGGAGAGFGPAIGVPAFRVLAAVSYAAEVRRRAAPVVVDDGDDVGEADACPNEPEDRDGNGDDDGCPDRDDDGDGVTDALDACPDEAEDVDGWRDDDGCADPKTRVGVRVVSPLGGVWAAAEVNVVCGTTARTLSADQALDVDPGPCTFGGGNAGGIAPFTRTVDIPPGPPLEVELLADGPPSGLVEVTVTERGGGAVEQAAVAFDGGRALRVAGTGRVRIPPGTHEVRVFAQGYRDHAASVEVGEGAPLALAVPLEPLPAWIGRGKLQLEAPLVFVPGDGALAAGSGPVLDAIAAELAANPEVRLRIEAHTAQGPASQLLSDERALVVRDALVERGVASERLDLVGFGASRPLPAGPAERIEGWVVP